MRIIYDDNGFLLVKEDEPLDVSKLQSKCEMYEVEESFFAPNPNNKNERRKRNSDKPF